MRNEIWNETNSMPIQNTQELNQYNIPKNRLHESSRDLREIHVARMWYVYQSALSTYRKNPVSKRNNGRTMEVF